MAATSQAQLLMVDPESAGESSGADLQETGTSVHQRSWLWRGGLVAGLLLGGAAVAWASQGANSASFARTAPGSLTSGLNAKYQGADSWIYTGVYDIPVRDVALRPIPGAPKLDLFDKNPCYGDEEFFGGLCYKKCVLLTAGEYEVRGTAFSCCRSHPCTLSNQKVEARVCSGFDVSGDQLAPGSCPHKPGACLENEELYLGMCYKKCSLLTEGTHPHRVTPATCCKEKSTFECLKFSNIKSNLAFDIGGGAGDNDDRTPEAAHLPLPELAEIQRSSR